MIVRKGRWAIAVWLVVVTGVAALLNSPLMFPTPRIWMRALPPVLLLFGVLAELNLKAGYRVVLSASGAWLFLVVVLLWNFVGDRDLHYHPDYEVFNGFAQLLFALLVIVWVHWRARSIGRKFAEAKV